MTDSHLTLSVGETLFTQGDEGDTMFVITTGEIQISRIVDGQKTVLANLGSGEFLGEMSLVNQEARSATGIATQPTTLMVYNKEKFTELLTTRPLMAQRIIERLADRLRQTTAQLTELKSKLD
jgi:CRP-like cAMP-binding protein